MLKEFQKFRGWQVLEYFFKTNEKISIRELARKLKISTMTAKYYCDVLEKANLLSSEKGGTAKLFSLKDNRQTKHWRLAYLFQLINESKFEDIIKNPFYLFGNTINGIWDKELDIFIIKINEFDQEKVRKIIEGFGFIPKLVIVEFYELNEYKQIHKPLIEEVVKGIYIGDEAHSLR
ncbi:winged helix-turn-helix domain-containing protein [Candidatus Micrarchaeota archaeon]|nr:winged helix-turn-helix domain-containing protein [Candidatus Micrarchaeota archaeon]